MDRTLIPAVVAAALAACSVDPPHFVLPNQDGGDDTPDARGGCEANTIVCDEATSHYVDCGSDGTVQFEMDCPLGCSPTFEKCLDVDPSNGLATYLDMASTAPDVDFSGNSVIDGAQVFNGPNAIEVPFAQAAGMNIYMFHSLTISGTLKSIARADEDGPPLAFVVYGDVIVDGTLDVSADGWDPGPGGYKTFDVDTGVGCNGSTYSSATGPTPGASGGGRYLAGGRGGNAGNGASAAGGGVAHDDPDLVPLLGGCAGGEIEESSGVSYGGGGGGAIQIVSRGVIQLTGSAKIDASGGGGGHGGGSVSGTIGGGGGGSGGTVLLEAPSIVLDGASVVISTKGGGGAAVGTFQIAEMGSDGGTSAGPAAGGTNASNPDGGGGGTETLPPGAGGNGTSAGMDGAGGGGSVGEVRFNTAVGNVNPQSGAVVRSRLYNGLIGSRLVP